MQSGSKSSSLKIQQISGTDGGVGGRSGRVESPSGRLKRGVSLGSRPVPPQSQLLQPFSEVPPALPGFFMFSSRKHQMPWKPGFLHYGLWASLRCHSHHWQPAVLFLTPCRETRLGFQQVKLLLGKYLGPSFNIYLTDQVVDICVYTQVGVSLFLLCVWCYFPGRNNCFS